MPKNTGHAGHYGKSKMKANDTKREAAAFEVSRLDDLVKSQPGFIKFIRSRETTELLKHPNAFTLLAVIAQRARRTDEPNKYNLAVGEALIGDHENYGMSKQQYRTAKATLQSTHCITLRTTHRGTIAKLINTKVFDINENESNTLSNTLSNTQNIPNKNVPNNAFKNAFKNALKKDNGPKSGKASDIRTPISFKEFETSFLKKYSRDDFIAALGYYTDVFEEKMKKPHPRLKPEQWERAWQSIQTVTFNGCTTKLTKADLCEMIDKHFQTHYKNCDYSVLHFASHSIMANRFYEVCY